MNFEKLIFIIIFILVNNHITYPFDFEENGNLKIYLNENLVAEAEDRFYLKIDNICGYTIASPEFLKNNKLAIYLKELEKPVIIDTTNFYYNSLMKSYYIDIINAIIIECHTNPSHGVLIEYIMDTEIINLAYYTMAVINREGNILFTVYPPHFTPAEYKTEISVFIDFCELGIVPYDFYDLSIDSRGFLLKGVENSYIVEVTNNNWQIYDY